MNPSIQAAMAIIEQYGGIGGEHHKAWVIDQVARAPAAVGNINGGVPKRPTHFRPAFSTPQDPEAGHDPSVG